MPTDYITNGGEVIGKPVSIGQTVIIALAVITVLGIAYVLGYTTATLSLSQDIYHLSKDLKSARDSVEKLKPIE